MPQNPSPGDLVSDLMTELAKNSTSAEAWQQGDKAESMWGVVIPSLAFSWGIGGCNIIPCQRYLGISGGEKSYKSTLEIEIGNWFIQQGGVHMHLDNENKLGQGDPNTTVDAMSWWNGVADRRSRVLKVCSSVEEWQKELTTFIEFNRTKVNPRKVGERVPFFGTIDSLTGRKNEDADRQLRKEGSAAGRGYPVDAASVTNYLEALNLLGTTAVVSWVQHMKEVIADDNGYGPSVKEKGASAAQFHCSTHIRLSRSSAFRYASHDSASFPGTVEGYDIWMRTARTCVGPGDRSLCVPVMWQYVYCEKIAAPRQVMWFDWYGALGGLLYNMKYNAKFKPKMFKQDVERLNEALMFTQKNQQSISCKALGLENVSQHAFGRAIEENEEVRRKVADFLGVANYPSVQDVAIDFKAGALAEKKAKK